MALKLYAEGLYLIRENLAGDELLDHPKKWTYYTERGGAFRIVDTVNQAEFSIAIANVGDWATDAGGLTPYTESTMRTFLQANTAV
jgi:hypothetical protein